MRKVGFLIPSTNTTVERDAARVLPAAVSAHFARLRWNVDDPEASAHLIDALPAGARLLADASVEAIAFACTTGSLDGGAGYDAKVIAAVEEAAGVPATTTSTAVVDALDTLGAHTVSLFSPYEDWENAKVVAFLEAGGFSVESVRGLGIADPRAIEAVRPDRIAEEVLALDDRADAVFVSCTAFRALEALELLRGRPSRPVLTSNQVTFWAAIRLLAEPPPLTGSLRVTPTSLAR
jgi:maleate isomerase